MNANWQETADQDTAALIPAKTLPRANGLTQFEREVLRLVDSEPTVGISKLGLWNSTVQFDRSMTDVDRAVYKLEDMDLIAIKPSTGGRNRFLDYPDRLYLPAHPDAGAGRERLAELARVTGGSSHDPQDVEPYQPQ